MEICRACLSTEVEMFQMDKTFTENYNILTGLSIKFTKNKPLYTCKPCFDGANFCTEFRNRCIASDLSLKEINQVQKHLTEEDNDENILIKEEMPLEINGNIDDSPDDYFLDELKAETETNDDSPDLISDHYSDERNEEEDFLAELKTETIDSFYVDNRKEEENDNHIDLLAELETKTTVKRKSKRNIQLQKSKIDNYYADNRKEEERDNHIDVLAKLETKTTVKRKSKRNIQLHKSKNEKLVIDLVHCKICPESFVDENGLTEHLKNHKFNVPCCLCGEHFISLPHLLSHRIEHMPKDQMKCHICSRKFLTALGLEFHYMRIHELAEKNTPIRCKQCPASFDTGRYLRRHIGELHSVIKYTCEICSFGFRKKNQLKLHMIKHEQTKRYECDLCDYATRYSGGLKAHKVRKHTEGRVYCKTCGHVYKSQSVLLEKHICKNALSSAVCPVCGLNITIRKTNSLKRHMRSHDDVCKYKCETCPAKFKSLNGYKTHMDKHAGTPKNCCEYCQRRFYSHTVLIKHLRTHTGEKPYVCSICKKGFTGNHNLKVHMKVHGIMNLIIKKDTNEG